VFEAEWTVLVFVRWCADIPQRGIMWQLPVRLRANIDELGIENLLHRSPYCVAEVRAWISDHDGDRFHLSTFMKRYAMYRYTTYRYATLRLHLSFPHIPWPIHLNHHK
jgi:hypothetical protein